MGSNLTMGVVLCTFNGERYVEAQVQSIRRQTRAPEFILACDDASEDRTFALLEACAAQAGVPMRVSRNRGNLGYLRNFERGILQCQADIIVLSDQDDFWRPDKLATIEEAFLKNQATLLGNQPALLSNQRTMIANQEAFIRNQERLLANQPTLLQNQRSMIANQETFLKTQERLLASQSSILAKQKEAFAALEGVVSIKSIL